GFKPTSALPALERRGAQAGVDADPGVHGDAAVRPRHHRVEVELRDFREILRELREAVHEVDERGRVGRRRAAEAADEPTRLPAPDELLGVDIGERRDPEARVADQLGENAAGTERDERPKDRVLDDAREQLDAAAQERLDEHGSADALRRRVHLFLVAEVERDAAGFGLVRAGRRGHSARSAAKPSACAADSGYGNAATGDSESSSVAGVPSALITTARTGFSVPASATACRIAAPTSSAPATTGGTKRTITASTCVSASSSGSAASYVGAVADPSRSTGFARLASRGSTAARAVRVSGASSGSDRPAASPAAAERIPSPPAFVTAAARRPRGG